MFNVSVREALSTDLEFMWDMLFAALYVPPGAEKLPRSVLNDPLISRYLEGWGRGGDMAFIAEVNNQKVGAIWVRIFSSQDKGFGWVDENTPEVTMAVSEDYRNKGVGSLLIGKLIIKASKKHKQLVLSVDKANAAVGLYKRFGFETVKKEKSSLTMALHFN